MHNSAIIRNRCFPLSLTELPSLRAKELKDDTEAPNIALVVVFFTSKDLWGNEALRAQIRRELGATRYVGIET